MRMSAEDVHWVSFPYFNLILLSSPYSLFVARILLSFLHFPPLQETVMIFLGSLIAAAAVEESNLHQRIALKVLLLFGTSPQWLLLGFMTNTMFLSMWIRYTHNHSSTFFYSPVSQTLSDSIFLLLPSFLHSLLKISHTIFH